MSGRADTVLDVGVERLSRDLANSASTLSREQARALVDAYYRIQDNRKRTENQDAALERDEKPHDLIAWMFGQYEVFEQQVKRALDKYSGSHPVGVWARDQVGIGPVLAAGLLAHIDITRSNTVGKLWAFAGLDPTRTWERGEKRPWNAALKVLCWKIGEAFVKTSTRDGSYYGALYAQRKLAEISRNRRGDFAELARAKVAAGAYGAGTEALLWCSGCLTAADAEAYYAASIGERVGLAKRLAGAPGSGVPMLAPDHIHARAKRWAVKLFLAHFHEIYWRHETGTEPPKPYAIAHLQHVDFIPAPQ